MPGARKVKERRSFFKRQVTIFQSIEQQKLCTLDISILFLNSQSLKSRLCTLFRKKSICLTFYDIVKYIEIEKAEAKYRRSHEEYKTSVSLFGNARDDFERKMTLATRRFQVTTSLTTQNIVTKNYSYQIYDTRRFTYFQEVETSHITQLRNHVETYCQIVDHNNNQLGRVYQDFQIQLTDLTIENLLEQFTLAKHTGFEKPGKFVTSSVRGNFPSLCFSP